MGKRRDAPHGRYATVDCLRAGESEPRNFLHFFFLIHGRIGDPKQLIERRLVDHGHFADPYTQGKPGISTRRAH